MKRVNINNVLGEILNHFKYLIVNIMLRMTKNKKFKIEQLIVVTGSGSVKTKINIFIFF